jgi:hypothetical protein
MSRSLSSPADRRLATARVRTCKATTRGLEPSGTSSRGRGRVCFAKRPSRANGPANASVVDVNRRPRGAAVPSRPREAPGNRTTNDDGKRTRLATAHHAENATGHMSTKQPNGDGFSVHRANRRGSIAAQRRPAKRANAQASYEKYVTLARAAARSGDVIETENCYQHAEHYFRMMKDERIGGGHEEADIRQDRPASEDNDQSS